MLDITGLFGTKNLHRPLINQLPIISSLNPSFGYGSVTTQKQKFWKWFKARPELNAPVQIRVDDTISGVEFFAVDGKPLGRNKRINAEEFWNNNFMYEVLKSLEFDALVTGSGFLWMGSPLKSEDNLKTIKTACDKAVRHFPSIKEVDEELRSNISNALFLKVMDEDISTPRIVDYVPSSTIVIEHDAYSVKNYHQYYAGNEVVFSPNEIIHIPLMRIDGKIDGFTPVESLGYELVLLWAIKENMLSYIRNGGSPNKAWILPDELANSTNHQWLTQQLASIGVLEARHGNFVVAGNVKIEDLEKNIKDMEYKDLALYVTSVIAFALRVPVSRIPFMIGGAQSKSDAGGLAESGYWSMIESRQKTLEMFLNSQLFNKVGFSIRFIKRYKIDDLREAQAMDMRATAVGKMSTELAKYGKKMTDDKMADLFDLSANDIEDMPDELKGMPGTPGMNPIKDTELMNSPEKSNSDAVRRTAAINNPKGNIQTGF